MNLIEAAYFTMGADAMKGKIVAWLAAKGHTPLSVELMSVTLPEPKEPEQQTVTKP